MIQFRRAAGELGERPGHGWAGNQNSLWFWAPGRLRRAQPDRELLVSHPGRWLHKDFSSAARSLRW